MHRLNSALITLPIAWLRMQEMSLTSSCTAKQNECSASCTLYLQVINYNYTFLKYRLPHNVIYLLVDMYVTFSCRFLGSYYISLSSYCLWVKLRYWCNFCVHLYSAASVWCANCCNCIGYRNNCSFSCLFSEHCRHYYRQFSLDNNEINKRIHM